MKNFAVAIDGPAGSGKSTAARMLSKRLGLIYVDTGAMYRAVALYCMENGINTKLEASVESVLKDIHLEFGYTNDMQQIFLNDCDVTQKVRTQECGTGASHVAAYSAVRQFLVELQRRLAADAAVVMDGRDVGTNVLPNANVKFFLTAECSERAKRRVGELLEKGIHADLDDVLAQMLQRDHQDATRQLNPLKKAKDAIELDTTNLTLFEAVEKMSQIICEKAPELKIL